VVERKLYSSVSGTLPGTGTTQISSEEILDAETKEANKTSAGRDAREQGNKRKRRNEQAEESTLVSFYYFIKRSLIGA
jgi:hypothetical protein